MGREHWKATLEGNWVLLWHSRCHKHVLKKIYVLKKIRISTVQLLWSFQTSQEMHLRFNLTFSNINFIKIYFWRNHNNIAAAAVLCLIFINIVFFIEFYLFVFYIFLFSFLVVANHWLVWVYFLDFKALFKIYIYVIFKV